MLRMLRVVAASCAVLHLAASLVSAITIPTVVVGNAGNAGDTTVMNDGTSGHGSVSYAYRIGRTEVTNAQYAEFLNFKAAHGDPLALYEPNMGNANDGGIARSGSGTIPDPYVYTTKANMGDKPVTRVSWFDALRFANWLHNGQGTGDTETGAYTLLGGEPFPSNGLSITRNPGAIWFLPSEDEWYKAAYHQPSQQGGDIDDYWLYPTATNGVPTFAMANSVGDISNPGINVANYDRGAHWNDQIGNVTTVGSAGPLSNSYYGTADQGGNVSEYTETLSSGWPVRRGGSWFFQAQSMWSSFRGLSGFVGDSDIGFRVATVPEPSTIALAALGLASLIVCAWRRSREIVKHSG